MLYVYLLFNKEYQVFPFYKELRTGSKGSR